MTSSADLVISQYDPAQPLNVRPWATFSVDDQLQITNKINLIIQTLNQYGKLNNDVVTDWNKVMQWAMNDGLINAVDSIGASFSDIVTVNDHNLTYTYDSNGNVSAVTEKDSSNIVIKTVTYTYNANGDVSQSVTTMNGKTVTTTYTYDVNGNITNTSNVIS